MADEPFYSPNRQPAAPRQAVPGEHVWTLRKGLGEARCELRMYPHGVEAQLFRDGSFYASRLLKSRAEALAHAEKSRDDLLADGWTVEKGGAR